MPWIHAMTRAGTSSAGRSYERIFRRPAHTSPTATATRALVGAADAVEADDVDDIAGTAARPLTTEMAPAAATAEPAVGAATTVADPTAATAATAAKSKSVRGWGTRPRCHVSAMIGSPWR